MSEICGMFDIPESMVSKLSSVYNYFLKTRIKNGLKQIDPINIEENNLSSKPIDRLYKITKGFNK